MYKAIIPLTALLLLSACSGDNPEASKSLQKATEHAKEAAKELGNAVSESTKETREKWSEMNKDRHEPDPVDQPYGQEKTVDTAALKEKYEAVKQVTIEKSQEGMEVVKEKYQDAKEYADQKHKEWSR